MAINDPILYYTMDSATTITDSGSGGHNGTPVNTPTSVTGKIGNAVSLNGSNQSITLPGAVIASLASSDFTIACWLYINSFTSYAAIFDSPSSNCSFWIDTATNGYASMVGSIGGLTFSSPWVTGAWQHVMIVQDSTGGTWQVYNNNVSVYSSTSFAGFPFANSDMAIGGNPSGGGTWLNGKIDEFRIYNRALTSTERSNLYAYTASGGGGALAAFQAAGLLAW